MITLKKILWTLIAVLVSLSLIGQSTFGLRGGVNYASMSNNPFDFSSGYSFTLEKEAITGLDVAAFVNIDLPVTRLSLQPELHYIQKGMQMDGTVNGITSQNVDITYRYNYIEVPVLVGYDLGVGQVKIRPFVGPSAGYALDGQLIGDNVRLSIEGWEPFAGKYKERIEMDTEFGLNGRKDVRWDYGVVGGVGVNIPMGKVALQLDGRYNHSLNERMQYNFDTPQIVPDKSSNRGFVLSAGLGFKLF